jgi:AraC-like DNA-binding protein
MESTYFSDFFHKKAGLTFSTWLQFLRIGKALELLRRENCSITEVASGSGFNDLSTFQKAFRKWTSLTPSEFKSIVRPA